MNYEKLNKSIRYRTCLKRKKLLDKRFKKQVNKDYKARKKYRKLLKINSAIGKTFLTIRTETTAHIASAIFK